MSDLTYEPATYYTVMVRCNTAGDGTEAHPPCVNYQREWEVTEVYSNAGQPVIQCGPCQNLVEILSAVKMDPQPEVS
jgi:hypothetical protein